MFVLLRMHKLQRDSFSFLIWNKDEKKSAILYSCEKYLDAQLVTAPCTDVVKESLKKILDSGKVRIHSWICFLGRSVPLFLVACKFPFSLAHSVVVSHFFLLFGYLMFVCWKNGPVYLRRRRLATRFEIQRCRTHCAPAARPSRVGPVVLLSQLRVPKLSYVLARCTILPFGFRETAVTGVRMLPVSFTLRRFVCDVVCISERLSFKKMNIWRWCEQIRWIFWLIENFDEFNLKNRR